MGGGWGWEPTRTAEGVGGTWGEAVLKVFSSSVLIMVANNTFTEICCMFTLGGFYGINYINFMA